MTGAPSHDDRTNTSIGDNLPAFPRVARVTSTGSLEASLLMVEKDMIPLKLPKLLDILNCIYLECNFSLLIHNSFLINDPMMILQEMISFMILFMI